jgi:hypothetical protein
VTAAHRLVRPAAHDQPAVGRLHSNPVAVADAQGGEVVGIDQQRTVRIEAAPRGGSVSVGLPPLLAAKRSYAAPEFSRLK